MNNGEITLGKIKPIFHTYCADGEIDRTSVDGYKIEYFVGSEDDVEGHIMFPVSMLGKTREETIKNVRKMINQS
ncbi:hypothetical protein P5667_15635 [Bacillus velezensis]|uniref:hypothetical protein n=1 Tax=Bacillus amyloliquefaciens group TaxID=1938374 RepID=UPI00024588B7|nr:MULTISPECIES: hypothetical protein [Bacillus amyloliquefaciens group]ERH55283.1 hypothetical protein O205_21205 [Bacillus amyloliquefaciens EGD-AQ14]MDH3087219.1 hypothetical protein [Bacillus velezensis]MEC0405742.1 hypothetical protein [Bacillus velezensis]PKF83681.1 hypothetical protein CWI74_07305 [Bacillus velezensis]WEY80395.1 hypothetical protein P5667_15635 [Bacillus velezensis]